MEIRKEDYEVLMNKAKILDIIQEQEQLQQRILELQNQKMELFSKIEKQLTSKDLFE